MTAKSILEVEIKDAAFKSFIDLFNKYNSELKRQSGTWNNINNAAGKASQPIGGISDDTKEIVTSLDRILNQLKNINQAGKVTENQSKNTRKNFLEIMGFSRDITQSMIKWGSIGAASLGTVAGGFYALKSISSSESNLRKETKILGIGAGELQSLQANLGKFIDVDGHLHAQNELRNDLSKRGGLMAAGLGGMENLNNADFLAQSLLKVRDTYIKGGGTEQAAQAYHLHEAGFSTDELQLLKNTTAEEIKAAIAKSQSDKNLLAQTDKQLKSWQDLNIQIDIFTKSLKVVTADVLLPIAKFINNPNASVINAGDAITNWIVDKDKKGAVGGWVDSISNAIAMTPEKKSSPSSSNPIPNALPIKSNSNPGQRNNPGNIRAPGQTKGFVKFSSEEEGLRAIAHQLQLYASGNSAAAKHRKLETIASIINTYAPSSENDTASYISDVSKRTGFGANQKLDLNDKAVLAKLVAAITKHENNKTNYTPAQVQSALSGNSKNPGKDTTVTINNQTGGNAVVALSTVAH